MTDDNAFKSKARKHQQATGDSYTRARRQVDKTDRSGDDAAPTSTLLRLLTISGPEPTPNLRVPLGLQTGGTPVWLDLRSEADGGNGPHGLIVGAAGSGKTTTLISLIFALCTLNSPEQVQVVIAESGLDGAFSAFVDYPHVRATFTDLERSNDAASAFIDTVRVIIDERARTPHDSRRSTKPTVIVVDDISTLCRHHPDAAGPLGELARKGRILGVHLIASSPTLGHPLLSDVSTTSSSALLNELSPRRCRAGCSALLKPPTSPATDPEWAGSRRHPAQPPSGSTAFTRHTPSSQR